MTITPYEERRGDYSVGVKVDGGESRQTWVRTSVKAPALGGSASHHRGRHRRFVRFVRTLGGADMDAAPLSPARPDKVTGTVAVDI